MELGHLRLGFLYNFTCSFGVRLVDIGGKQASVDDSIFICYLWTDQTLLYLVSCIDWTTVCCNKTLLYIRSYRLIVPTMENIFCNMMFQVLTKSSEGFIIVVVGISTKFQTVFVMDFGSIIFLEHYWILNLQRMFP